MISFWPYCFFSAKKCTNLCRSPKKLGQRLMKIKTRLLLFFTLLGLHPLLEAQLSEVYSIVRPISGGNLQLVAYDLVLGTETIIQTYNPSQLDDYNPESTTFDPQANKFISIGTTLSGSDSIISINALNGNIDIPYASSSLRLAGLEYGNGKVYSWARPFLGGNISLVELDLSQSTETIIKTYQPSELDDCIPESMSFDYDSNQLLTLGSDTSGLDRILSINIANGNIEHSYYSPNSNMADLKYAHGKVYSLRKPLVGGNWSLVEFDVVFGTELTIRTYTSLELFDYFPRATTFDHQSNSFITVRSDSTGNRDLISLNTVNGNIEHTYLSPNLIPPPGIESSSLIPTGIIKQLDSNHISHIFPNPAGNFIRIAGSNKFTRIEIFNTLGNKVLDKEVATSAFDISSLVPGVYIVTLHDEFKSTSELLIKD